MLSLQILHCKQYCHWAASVLELAKGFVRDKYYYYPIFLSKGNNKMKEYSSQQKNKHSDNRSQMLRGLHNPAVHFSFYRLNYPIRVLQFFQMAVYMIYLSIAG